jgi:hypothetical protein
MKPEERLQDILDRYGLDRILEDNRWEIIDVLDLLEELGYINLEMYEEEE